MTLLAALWEQLPILLVLSPVVGCIASGIVLRLAPDLIRPFAVANVLCTLLIATALEWQFETQLNTNAALVQYAEREHTQPDSGIASPAEVRRKLDRFYSERIQNRWFAVDGINLFPALFLILITIVVIFRTTPAAGKTRSTIPFILLYEAAGLGSLTANDVVVFLMTSVLSLTCLAWMIGGSGPSDRRGRAERFLMTQCCGGGIVLLGLAMLVVSVPWMKIQDSVDTPNVASNLASLIFVQRWAGRNELAFHYQNEVFPGMLLVLSVGFAVLAGLFPFHSSSLEILKDSEPETAVLYIAGTLSTYRMAWLRFVMPVSPDLMASFDNWILIPALAGGAFGALSGSHATTWRQRCALVFLSLSSLSLLGCFSFTRIGMCGTWLMQQQLMVLVCAVLLLASAGEAVMKSEARSGFPSRQIFSTRKLLLLLCLPILSFFASGYLILSELILESLPTMAIVSLVLTLLVFQLSAILNKQYAYELQSGVIPLPLTRFPRPVLLSLCIAIIVAGFPNLLLRQCEPEFARVFRRFEQSITAFSADTDGIKRQSTP